MANEFKVPVKLAVDGEASFKEAMSQCSKSMALLSSESKKVSAEYSDNKNSLEALTKQQEISNSKIDVQKSKIEALRKALEDEVKENGNASEKAIKYATDLNKAETALIGLEKENKAITKAYEEHSSVMGRVKDSYSAYKKKIEELDKAHPALKKSLEAVTKVAEGLGKVALKSVEVGAKTAVGSVTALTTGAVALGKAIFNSAEACAEYGDKIDKASQKMGIASEEYQKLSYVTNLAGTNMETLQKATQKLQASGSDLDISQALDQLYAIEDADERAAKAHEMFGDKIANELAPMLNQSAKDFESAKQSAEDYGLVMSDAAVKASAAFSDTKTTLVDTVTMIKNNLASELLPGINEVMEGITGLFTGDEGATKKIEDGINQLIEDLDSTIDKVSNILGKIIDAVMEAAPKIIPSLVEGILKNLDKLIDCAFELIDALADGLLTEENIQLIMNGAVKLLTKLVDALLDNIDLIVNATMEMVTSLCDALTDNRVLPKLAKGALDVVKAIATALIDNAPELLDSAIEMGAQLVQGLIDYDWVSLAKNIYNSIKGAIIGFFGGNKEGSSSHAGGLDYVPTDGSYILHKGERVLTASEAQAQTNNDDMAMLNAKIDYLMNNQQQGNVNVNISGSAGAIVRALNIDIERENRRKSAFA